MIAPQVQVIVRDQEHAEGVVVAVAAGESLENGPTPLRFLRSKTHVVPLGKPALSGVYVENIRRPPVRRKTDQRNGFGGGRTNARQHDADNE